MTPLDFGIIVFALAFGLVGVARGFLTGALSLAGFAAGAWLGTRFGPDLLNVDSTSPYAPLFGLVGALVAGTIISLGAEGLGARLRGAIRIPGFAFLDGLLGFALSVALALGLTWVVSVIVLQTPGVREWRRTVQRSTILTSLNEVLPSDRLLKAFARFDPFPSIDGPQLDVGPPKAAVARDPDVGQAGNSVVRILGTACGLGVSGSGWVAGDGLVVTNAHVIAGQDDTVVELRGRGPQYNATAVAFDTLNDIAVLRVSSLQAPVLRFARVVKPTEPGAVLGFPLNGSYDVRAARVGSTRTVISQDAYGRGPVRRKITTFRGSVKPGNSGGPIVDVAGRVSGTVFAKSVGASPAGGYAVPNDVVRRTLSGARDRVGTGPCVR
ncbi:MAG: MarP family serine protease [Actinomycetota bacterium]|nr:MarP family serine protease [Actinomycetota bacterium]